MARKTLPLFLQHPEIYTLEFWHAPVADLIAQQPVRTIRGESSTGIVQVTAGTSETCARVAHLVVFLPPALRACVLSHHPNKVSPTLTTTTDAPQASENGNNYSRISPTAQLAPPTMMNNARRSAAGGTLALCHPTSRQRQNRVVWSLKFPLPAPSDTVLPADFQQFPVATGLVASRP